MQVPDYNDAFDAYEAEQARRDRVRRREEIEDIRPEDLPFYYDHITISETFGKGINNVNIV